MNIILMLLPVGMLMSAAFMLIFVREMRENPIRLEEEDFR